MKHLPKFRLPCQSLMIHGSSGCATSTAFSPMINAWITSWFCCTRACRDQKDLTEQRILASSTVSNNTSNAWIVNPNNGNTNNNDKTNSNRAVCAR